MKSEATPYHHGELRETLLDAAATAIEDSGIEALSLRKLARSAGVSHNAPYMHFKDKEALVAALAQRGFQRLGQAVRTAGSDPADDWLQSFRKGVHAYVEFATTNPALYATMHRNYAVERFPDTAAAGAATFERLVISLEGGQTAGLIAPRPAQAQALTVWTALHGLSFILGVRPDGPTVFGGASPTEVTDQLIDTLLKGLEKP